MLIMLPEKPIFWLISVCCGQSHLGVEFHFRGYLYGYWVKKIIIISSELTETGSDEWELGETYLLQLMLVDIRDEGSIMARLLQRNVLNAKDRWEAY